MTKTDKREKSNLISRNVIVNGRRTSLRLEPEMWEALDEVAQRENQTINEVVGALDRTRADGSLTSEVRAFVLSYFRRSATERGHWAVGHGVLFARGLTDKSSNRMNDAPA